MRAYDRLTTMGQVQTGDDGIGTLAIPRGTLQLRVSDHMPVWGMFSIYENGPRQTASRSGSPSRN